ncbi:hypothetical protein JCM10908_004502 [Rhodotorula pacifica]|uniref:uncharacterized protein n=1 Tax=Rhodotorula pacifica TaxID=1495444 RepID=UPI00317F9882
MSRRAPGPVDPSGWAPGPIRSARAEQGLGHGAPGPRALDAARHEHPRQSNRSRTEPPDKKARANQEEGIRGSRGTMHDEATGSRAGRLASKGLQGRSEQEVLDRASGTGRQGRVRWALPNTTTRNRIPHSDKPAPKPPDKNARANQDEGIGRSKALRTTSRRAPGPSDSSRMGSRADPGMGVPRMASGAGIQVRAHWTLPDTPTPGGASGANVP